jgi:mRNA-degrading endonuclease RelE of RelBE toxin-antitoxin system
MRADVVELVTVVETSAFSKQASEIWTDEERDAFVYFIAANPEAGAVIRETGGVRKVRWSAQGRGTRGGARVIYFFYNRNAPIYLLMAYSKSVREDLSRKEKKQLRDEVAKLKKALGQRKDVPNE